MEHQATPTPAENPHRFLQDMADGRLIRSAVALADLKMSVAYWLDNSGQRVASILEAHQGPFLLQINISPEELRRLALAFVTQAEQVELIQKAIAAVDAREAAAC